MTHNGPWLIELVQILLFIGRQLDVNRSNGFVDPLLRAQSYNRSGNNYHYHMCAVDKPSLAKTHAVAICAIVTPFFFASSSTRLTISFPKALNSFDSSIPFTKLSWDRVVCSSGL